MGKLSISHNPSSTASLGMLRYLLAVLRHRIRMHKWTILKIKREYPELVKEKNE